MRTSLLLSLALGLPLFLVAGIGAKAQDFSSTFSGLDPNSNEPIQIESDRLEVNDVDKIATYTGAVQVRQGDTIIEAPKLVVYYSGDAATGDASTGSTAASGSGNASGASATPGSTNASDGASGSMSSRVTRLEAGPGVNVRSGTQTATGDNIVFDLPNNLVTLSGNVVLTEGDSVVRGDRLIVNTTTKIGHVEGGRVQTLITPSSNNTATQ